MSSKQRHEMANDPWEKGLMTADDEFLADGLSMKPRPFTPAAFLQAMKERSIAAARRHANPSGACGIRGG